MRSHFPLDLILIEFLLLSTKTFQSQEPLQLNTPVNRDVCEPNCFRFRYSRQMLSGHALVKKVISNTDTKSFRQRGRRIESCESFVKILQVTDAL